MSSLTSPSASDATDALEISTIRKTIMMVVPLMLAMYVVAYIDRQNISFAKLQMVSSLGWSESAFGLGSSLFFIGYLLFSVPGNMILAKIGAKRWFALSLCGWGIITISLAFTQSLTMFYSLRFVLGLAEASFYPGLIYYSTQWFPIKYRPRIVGFLVTASMFANMIGAPLNGSLLSMHGLMGYEGWQWLFFVTGLLALVLVVPVLALFPGTPDESRFLSADQKKWLLQRLEAERREQADKSVDTLFKSLTDKRVLALALVYGFICFGAYGISYWMPTIVKSFGVSDMANGFLNMIPWALVMLLLRWLTKNPERTTNPFINVAMPMFTSALCLIGSVYFFTQPAISFAFICGVVLSVFAIQPCFWNMAKFLSGASAAAGLAAINSLANLGGFFAQNTIPLVRDQMQSASAPMIYLALVMLVGGISTVMIIKWLQRKGAPATTAPATN